MHSSLLSTKTFFFFFCCKGLRRCSSTSVGGLIVVGRCADSATLWTSKGLGWECLGVCSLFLPPASFAILCFYVSNSWLTFLTVEHQLSVWGCALPCLMADSCLCTLSPQLVFVTLSGSATIILSFTKFTEEDCFGHMYMSSISDVAIQVLLNLKRKTL